MIARVFRVATIVCVVVALLWGTLIAGPMWLTRWRMSRLLADYHSIYPTRTRWADAQELMAKWGKWGNYDGTCNADECDYGVRMRDLYSGWIEKLPEKSQSRIYDSHLLEFLSRIGYRASVMSVRLQVLSGKVVRTYIAMAVDVQDSGPPEHYQYPLVVTAQSRSNLSQSARTVNNERGVYGWRTQLDLHFDYEVSRPGGCEICVRDDIAFTFGLTHETMVQLTTFDLRCLTQLRPCTTVGDLLPFGAGWRLWEGGPSSLYPTSRGASLPCRTEPSALARDATTVLEVEPLTVLPAFKTYGDDRQRELVRVRILNDWKDPIPHGAGSTIQVAPFEGEASTPYQPSTAPEHLLPGNLALLFVSEKAPTDFGVGGSRGPVAYDLDRCGVLEDTPANLAAVQRGIAEDISYPHPLQTIGWW